MGSAYTKHHKSNISQIKDVVIEGQQKSYFLTNLKVLATLVNNKECLNDTVNNKKREKLRPWAEIVTVLITLILLKITKIMSGIFQWNPMIL